MSYLEANQDNFSNLSEPDKLITETKNQFFNIGEDVSRIVGQVNQHLPKIIKYLYLIY